MNRIATQIAMMNTAATAAAANGIQIAAGNEKIWITVRSAKHGAMKVSAYDSHRALVRIAQVANAAKTKNPAAYLAAEGWTVIA